MQNNNSNRLEEDGANMPPFVPFEKAWAGLIPALDLEAKRREKRKKRFAIFWFSLVIMGMVAGGWFAYLQMPSPEQITEQRSIKSEKSTAINNASRVDSLPNSTNTKALANEKQIGKKHLAKPKTNPAEHSYGGITVIALKDQPALKAYTSKKVIGTSTASAASLSTAIAKGNKVNKNLVKTKAKLKRPPQAIAIKADRANQSTVANTKSVYGSRNDGLNENNKEQQQPQNQVNLVDNSPMKNAKALPTVDTATILAKSTSSVAKDSISPRKPFKDSIKSVAKNWKLGLEWRVPAMTGINLKDVNGNNQPLSLLIPQIWISKQLDKKQSLMLSINPYAVYYVSNATPIRTSRYDVTINRGSNVSGKADNNSYVETVSANKMISIAAALTYQYQILPRLQLGVGIGSNWLQSALIENKVVKNNLQTTRDSLYGIDKNSTEWRMFSTQFFTAHLELGYQWKQCSLGVSFTKPLQSISPLNAAANRPLNTFLFCRWRIRK